MQEQAKTRFVIAVDFDGVICTSVWKEPFKPLIGTEVAGAIVTLKKLKARGHKLILWTGRIMNYGLPEAQKFCLERGLEFDAVNGNVVNVDGFGCSPKIYADIYIDDRNIDILGENVKWPDIYKKILYLEEVLDGTEELNNKVERNDYFK